MHPIVNKIDHLRHRITYHRYATAICRTVASLTAAALLLGAADYIVRFRDTGLRVLSSAAFAIIVAWVAYRWWYRPRSARVSKLAVARQVESRFPQLNDSLASAVEFLEQSEHDQTAGSAQLRRLVVAEAETAIEGLPLDEIVDRRPLRRAATWLGAAAAVLALCLLWDAVAVGTALARLAAPLGGAEWPRQNHLAFRHPPTRLAAGQTFEVELIDEAGELPDDVRIEYRTFTDGRRESISQPMDRVGDVMVARRENVRQPFAFRAVGGDDTMMKWHRVDVVEPPQLKSLTVTLHPPKYTGLPRAEAGRHIEVLAGSSVEVEGVSSEPLGAARIVHAGQPAIDAAVAQTMAAEASAFRVAAGQWIPKESGAYQLELVDRESLSGVAHEWNVRVENDAAPTIEWRSPGEDIYVLPTAVVPISLAVKDNLAVAKVDLAYDRSDWSEAERERSAGAARIEVYRGPDTPTLPESSNAAAGVPRGESLVVDDALDLAALDLPAGAEVSIVGEAADYRPGTGRTTSPRRITIVTPDEFDQRVAERQTQIVRQLERALAVQRATRDDAERLQIQLRETASLTAADRSHWQSAELGQRRAARILVDPTEGVIALVDSLLNEFQINRVEQTEFRDPIERLKSDLVRLGAEPLSIADRELIAGRKTLDSISSAATVDGQADAPPLPPEQVSQLGSSLTTTIASQNEVINSIERWIDELSSAGDHQRFARLISELREDQLAHESTTRAAISAETIPLRLSDLTKSQRAELAKATTGQAALLTRFEKIEQAIDAAAQATTAGGQHADLLTNAVDLSRSLAIASKMNESARDLGQNRVGTALDREVQIAADLQQVLDALRGASKLDSDQKVARLQEAANELDILRQQVAELRQQIEKLEAQPTAPANEQQNASLGAQQAELERQIRQLARELDRLQAAEASQSTQSAADQLKSGAQSADASQQPAPKPAPSGQVQKAEADLEAAAERLAQQRRQAEEDLALEIVRRFQTQLSDMVERQRSVITETENLAADAQPDAERAVTDADRIAKLTAEERALAEMAKEHSELLVGLGAVRVSLEDAENRLLAAANLLQTGDAGAQTQEAERAALVRLEGMQQAFAQTASDAQQNQQQPPAGQQPGENPEGPQRRPTFELLEVKMLRMLQADLQERTKVHQQQVAGLTKQPNEATRANLQRESQELATEQARLAELVEAMLARDNKDSEQ